MKKRKIRRTMGVFFTTFLLLQIILLFLYKAFIVDIAKKNEENLVENTLQIYHNTMEGVLERLDDNLDLLLGYRLLLTQLNGENNLEKVKAQYKMLQILKERCKDTKEADAYAVVNCKDNSILIQRNGNITYDTIKDIKKYLQKRNTFDKTPTSGWTSTVMGAQVYLVKYYNYGANTIAVLISEKRLDSLLNYNDMSIKEAAFYLTDKKGEILCASGKDWAYGEEIENLQKQDPSISIYQGSVLEDAYQMYYSVKSSEYAAYSTSGIVIFGFLVLSLLFFGTIVWYMQKEIFRPIADLFWVSRKIHSGDFRARAEYNTNSYEMEEVKQAYNDMVQTILEMRGQKYEQELRMKDVQLKYIHMQLKPHYFLNALSTINSMVYQHEEENVHTFIQAFSQNIRYMFRTGLHTVPLQDEIKNAEGYLEMQRLMYRDCFYVYMDVPEELQQYPVPQMILHTFLENIFKHVISIDSFTTVLIQALLRVTEKIAWKQKTEEIREYWKIGKRKMVRYFWTRVLLEPGVQKQGLEEEIKQQGIEEEIQEKYCVVILHFASDKMNFGKEKEQESIYKFAMENILAEAFTEKIRMENVICWEENKGTYLGILSEFSERETKERAAQVRNIFEKYFPDVLQIGYISPSVPFYEAGLEKEKIMEYDKTHIYDEGEIKEFMALLREKEASGHILDEDYILQCLNKGSRLSIMEYLQKTLQHVKQTMHSVEGFRNFQVELTQLVSKYLHDKKENMNSVIRDPIYLQLDMNAVKSEFSMVQWMTWLMNKVFDLTQEERKEKTEKRITDQVIDYIREHYTEDINRNTLSERFHFSPEYIGKMFRKDTGTSLNDYINSLRVEKAKHLLENTNTKVIDIALEVGFDTLPYFSSVFKKYTGVSPAEFRKKE